MGFKENLKELRFRSGLTQAALAAKAGLPLRTLQNWEGGYREPRIPALVLLADALGVTVDALVRPAVEAGGKGAKARGGVAPPSPGYPPVPQGGRGRGAEGAAEKSGPRIRNCRG